MSPFWQTQKRAPRDALNRSRTSPRPGRSEDLGPHRGVRALSSYLASGQASGAVRADVDPEAVALAFMGSCFLRASHRQMPLEEVKLPALDDVIAAFVVLLAPG